MLAFRVFRRIGDFYIVTLTLTCKLDGACDGTTVGSTVSEGATDLDGSCEGTSVG